MILGEMNHPVYPDEVQDEALKKEEKVSDLIIFWIKKKIKKKVIKNKLILKSTDEFPDSKAKCS